MNVLTTPTSATEPRIRRGVVTSQVSSLSLRELSKVYGDHRAVDGLSVEVPAGEFFTLLGPSGSGKTTTLLMIAGFVPPTSGQVRINTIVVNQVPPDRRNIGLVFQNYALFPHLTIQENLAFPLEMRRVARSEIRSKVGDAVALFRLEGQQHKYPSQLSGGQQQRVALARALIFEPSLLLLDEPLGALDKQLRSQLQIELRLLQRRLGVTVVYVTHDQEEALTMSDRIAVMNRGRIEQMGSAADLYEQPDSLFVAEFLGENNLLPGRVLAVGDDNVRLQLAGGLEIECQNRGATDGSQASMAVRPERVRLSRAEGPSSPVRGVVSEVIYLGGQFKYLVDCSEIGRIAAIEGNTGQSEAFTPGSHVFVGWRSQDAKAFPRAGSGDRNAAEGA